MLRWISVCLVACWVSSGCGQTTPETTTELRPSEAETPVTAPKVAAQAENKPASSSIAKRNPPQLPAPRVRREVPPAGPLDLSYITPEFFGAIVIRPRQIADSEVLAGLPQDELLSSFIGGTSIDPRDVEHLLFLIGPPSPEAAQEPFMPAAVVKFVEPINGRETISHIWGEVEEKSFAEWSYLRQTTEAVDPPSAYIADEKTMVIAAEKTLQRMIEQGRSSSPLTERLRTADMGRDISALFVVEPVRTVLSEVIRASAPQYSSVSEDLDTAILNVHLDGHELIQLTLEGRDDAATSRLEGVAKEAVALVQGAYPLMLRSAVLTSMPQEFGQPLIRTLDQAVERITVAKKAQSIQVVVQSPPELRKLSATLLPMLQNAREASQRAQLMNNMTHLGLALHAHRDRFQTFPAAAISDAAGRPLLSWRVAALQYLGPNEEALYREFHLDEPWNSEHNLRLVERMPAIFAGNVDASHTGKTTILLATGEGSPFTSLRGPRLNEIIRGGAKTAMLVMASPDRAVTWTEPTDLAFDPRDPLACLGAIPEEGLFVTYFDGNTDVIRKDITATEFAAIVSDRGDVPATRAASVLPLNPSR